MRGRQGIFHDGIGPLVVDPIYSAPRYSDRVDYEGVKDTSFTPFLEILDCGCALDISCHRFECACSIQNRITFANGGHFVNNILF